MQNNTTYKLNSNGQKKIEAEMGAKILTNFGNNKSHLQTPCRINCLVYADL